MVRSLSRSLVTACTMMTLLATALSPMLAEAMGMPEASTGTHACCPETIGVPHTAQAPRAPMPCCEIGGRSLPEPVRGQTARTEAVASTPVVELSGHQAARPAIEPPALSGVPPVQIPLLLRTTVLLI